MYAKKKFRLLMIIRNCFLLIIAIILIWFIFHQVMNLYEKNHHSPIGKRFNVEEYNMHVYMKGKCENTIVLLPGLGTAASALDFQPLVEEMSKDNRVIVVEPFGYGWSDTTNKERTVENIVEEIRLALKKSNIEGPYLLMPHSISGIYSMYYANKYPDEVNAVIGIDATLPKATQYFSEDVPTMPKFMRYVAPTGLARIALYIEPDDYLPLAEDGTYSKENLQNTKAISARKAYNKNVVNEANEIKNNIDKTNHMSFPTDMPVLFFAAKKDKVNAEGKTNVTFYQTQLTKFPASKIVTLEGHHYLHWTHFKEMSDEVNEFLVSINAN